MSNAARAAGDCCGWLTKPVTESKLLDDAEWLSTWQLVNTDQANGEMTVTQRVSHWFGQ
jgi:hypothetical protein